MVLSDDLFELTDLFLDLCFDLLSTACKAANQFLLLLTPRTELVDPSPLAGKDYCTAPLKLDTIWAFAR